MTRNLLRNESGATMLEFTVGAVLFFGVIFALADFTRVLWFWNSAEKATQIGVRAAVITDPVALELATFDCDTINTALGSKCSDPQAASYGTVTCGGNPLVCTKSAGSALAGPTPVQAVFDRILARMQVGYPSLQQEHVIVEYRDIGLGFAGRDSPVPSVTVRLTGLTFEFIGMAAFGLSTITLPDFTSTLIGEDLSSAAQS